jgi:hypothetical protein
MLNKVKDFNSFINEADLKGNIGIPGEEGSGRESWLDKASAKSAQAASEFKRTSFGELTGFMRNVQRSQELQRGHEKELSELATSAIEMLYGTLLDDVNLDLKISLPQEVKDELDETPTEQSEIEELLDEDVINQIHKRKILRTIQQGKGLSVKAILNLSVFKEGLKDILGETADEYLDLMNRISTAAQIADSDIPEEHKEGMWKSRAGFSGSCSIEFDNEVDDEKEDIAQKVLDDLENGDDIFENPNAEELLDGIGVTVRARGLDLSILLHEAVKGVYMLITQASLEALYGGTAETVLQNTDTLLDELQEIKYGRQMQDAFFKVVSENPRIKEIIESMINTDSSDIEIASFQEKINFLFFGKIAMLGEDDAKEMLTLVNLILSESEEASNACESIIDDVLNDLNQEEEYQSYKSSGGAGEYSEPSREEPTFEPEETSPRGGELSPDEVNDAIIDAYERGDMEEVKRLRREYLGESVLLSYRAWTIINS